MHDSCLVEDALEIALVIVGREHEQLARDILVAAILRELVADVQQPTEVARDVQLARRALDLRELIQRLAQSRAQQIHVRARLQQQGPHGTALLVQQRRHQVHRLDELVTASDGERLRVGERHLELGGQFVHAHRAVPPQ